MTGFSVGEKVKMVTFTKGSPPYRVRKYGVVTQVLDDGYAIQLGKKSVKFVTEHVPAPAHIIDGYEGYIE
jgi:hypothetical protein